MKSVFCLVIGAMIFAACDGPSAPPEAPIGLLSIEPASVQLLPGDTQRFTAVALDAGGRPMQDVELQWQSSDATKVIIDQTGLATALPGPDGVERWAGGNSVIRVTARKRHADAAAEVCKEPLSLLGKRFVLTVATGHFPPVYSRAGFLDGTVVLWKGHLLLGTSTTGWVGANTADHGFTTTPLCRHEIDGGIYTRSKVGIRTPAPIPPVDITQETLSFDHAPLDGFVLIRYTFRNNSNALLNGLRVGFNLDWDLHFNDEGFRDDIASYDPEWDAAVTSDASGATVGIAGVGVAMSAYKPLPTVDSPGDFRQLYTYLDPVINTRPLGPMDVQQYVGFGELSIPPGETRSVTVAMVAAHSRAEFVTGLAWARTAAGDFPTR